MARTETFEAKVYLNQKEAQNAMAELEAQIVDTAAALKKFNEEKNSKKSIEAEQHLKRLRKQYEEAKHGVENYCNALKSLDTKSIKELTRMKKALNEEIKKLKPNTEEYIQRTKEFKQVESRIRSLEKAYKDTSSASRRWLEGLNNISGSLLLVGKGIRTAIALARRFAEAYKTISNFEQANANLASILGATSEQMEILEKAAIQLGSSTRYSASQVTGLQTELAKLGFTVKEITDMSPAVLNFAGSVGTDLASAAALAGVALRSFNLGSEQTEDALGTMAVACNKSALSFTYLQNSFSTIAPVAKTYGLSLKDTIALLGTLANAGFDASSAATATRNILLNLSDTNGKLAKALGGSVNSFDDIINAMIQLRDQGVDLNDTLELTDKRSVAAFNTFLDGAESARSLRGALEDVNGELQKMAEQRANTVEGAIDGMKSAWEGLVLSFRGSTGTFAEVFRGITDGINAIKALIDPSSAVSNEGAGLITGNLTEQYKKMLDPEEFGKYVDEQLAAYDEKIQQAGKKTRRWGWASVLFTPLLGKWADAKGVKTELEGERAVFEAAANDIVGTVNLTFSQELTQLQNVYNREMKEIEDDMSLSWDEVHRRQAEITEKYYKDRQTLIKKDFQKNQALKEAEAKEAEKAGKKRTKVDEKEAKKAALARQQAYNKQKAQMEAFMNYQEKTLKVAWLKGEIGEADYNSLVYQMKSKHYAALLSLAQKYAQDDSSIRNKMLDDHIKALEEEKKLVKEELEEIARYQSELNAEDESRFGKQEAKNGISDQGAYDSFQEKIWAKAAEVRASITDNSARTEYETEIKWAQKLAEQKKITAEEAERYILQAKLKYAQAAAQQVSQITEQASNFVTALKEAESAQLEAEYQKQLTAAGDNAEERERIEAAYEQRKLDIQKKYADADMVINIAKTIGAGALAVMQAFAQLGPVAGAVAAALIGVTTAAEVATIIAQRNAIKNTSVSSSGSVSAPKTGQRKMTGYAEGGYTEGHTTLTTVGEKGVEYVIPHWMVQRNPVMVANLERYRKAGSHGRSGTVHHGFADGGYTTQSPSQPAGMMPVSQDVDWQAMREFNAVMRYCAEHGLFVKYGDILIAKDKMNNFKTQTTR